MFLVRGQDSKVVYSHNFHISYICIIQCFLAIYTINVLRFYASCSTILMYIISYELRKSKSQAQCRLQIINLLAKFTP